MRSVRTPDMGWMRRGNAGCCLTSLDHEPELLDADQGETP